MPDYTIHYAWQERGEKQEAWYPFTILCDEEARAKAHEYIRALQVQEPLSNFEMLGIYRAIFIKGK